MDGKKLSNQSQEHGGIPSAESKATCELDAALAYLQGCHAERGERLSDGSDGWVIDSDCGSIAEMQCPADVEEAAARLLAAAPTLYTALKDLRGFLNVTPLRLNDGDSMTLSMLTDAAHAALALAHGQDTNSLASSGTTE